MSRVVEHDRAPRRVLERAMTAAAVGCGLILAPLGGSALAAVPVIFGSQWRDVAYTLAPACVALLLGGPVSLATAGYLYALGDVRSILRSSILHTVAWFAFTLPLLPLIGVPAVGVGWIAGALVDASVLSRAARAHAGISRVRPVIFPTVMAVAAGSASFAVAATLRPTPAGAGASIGVALATYVAGLAIAARLRPRSATVEPLAAFARSGRDILRRRTRRPANVTADALGRP